MAATAVNHAFSAGCWRQVPSPTQASASAITQSSCRPSGAAYRMRPESSGRDHALEVTRQKRAIQQTGAT